MPYEKFTYGVVFCICWTRCGHSSLFSEKILSLTKYCTKSSSIDAERQPQRSDYATGSHMIEEKTPTTLIHQQSKLKLKRHCNKENITHHQQRGDSKKHWKERGDSSQYKENITHNHQERRQQGEALEGERRQQPVQGEHHSPSSIERREQGKVRRE